VTKAINDIDDPRLVKALAHPIRIRILGILEHRTASPKELALEMGLPLENVSYHVRALKQFGFIKLERKRQVRGAIEHHYRAVARPRITADAWEQLPTVVKRAMTSATLGQLGELVRAAATDGAFDRPESHLARVPATLDEQGFAAASAVLTETVERLQAVEAEAQARIRRGESDPLPAVAVMMLFDRPHPGAPPEEQAGAGAGADGDTRRKRRAVSA
jgi:DNA-binding transcriptional ArsR family regulator